MRLVTNASLPPWQARSKACCWRQPGARSRSDGGIVYLATRSISEYEDEDLSTQYLAALRKQGTGWVEQDQVMRAFAHRLGFLRAGSAIRERGEVQIRKLRRAKVVTISGQEIRLC